MRQACFIPLWLGQRLAGGFAQAPTLRIYKESDMLFLVVQEPKQKYRAAMVVSLKVVAAKHGAEAKRLAKIEMTGPYAKDFKAPYALEIQDGAEFRV